MLHFNAILFTPPPTPRLARPAICTLRRVRRTPLATADPVSAARDALSSPAGQQAAIGGVLGYATGFTVRKVGQLMLVLVGLQVVAVQLMAQRGWLIVDWKTISHDLSPHVDRNRLDRVVDAFARKMPFGTAFTAACYAGLRWN